jgi:hypothetical protein
MPTFIILCTFFHLEMKQRLHSLLHFTGNSLMKNKLKWYDVKWVVYDVSTLPYLYYKQSKAVRNV